jgi:trigger factor
VKVTTERQPGCLVELTIEASAEEMAEAKEAAYREMAPRVPVPGFRPGKAPRNMIQRQIGDERLLTEALGELLPNLYERALLQENVQPYSEGDVHVIQRDPAIIKATVPLAPTVTLGDYRTVRMQREPVVVEDSEVDAVLARLQEEHATWAPAGEERTVQLGDQVVADLRGTAGDQVIADRKGMEMLVSEERGIIIPGLASEIVGSQREIERSIPMVLPETFSNEDLRGKSAEFVVTVHEIKEKQLPALDDEFAREFGEVADMAELTGRARQALQTDKEHEAEDRFEAGLLAQIVQMSTLEYPRVMLEEELNLLVRRAADRWKERGLDLDTYLKITQKSPESFRSELEPEARRRLESGLVLGKLTEAENVTIEPAEVDLEIERMSWAYGDKADEARKTFSSERAKRSIASMVLERKSIGRLIAIATGEMDALAVPTDLTEVTDVTASAEEAEAAVATEASEPTEPVETAALQS